MKKMREEAAVLEAMPEEEREFEENKMRQAKLAEQFHVRAHRRYTQLEAAKEKAEKEGKRKFDQDKPERERQKEAERLRQKQKEDEEQVRQDRRKAQEVKDRIEVLERTKDWTEVIEEAKVTGRERFMAEEEERGRGDVEVMEEEWQEIAASYDVLLPGLYLHIPESLEFVERHCCKVDQTGHKLTMVSLVAKRLRV